MNCWRPATRSGCFACSGKCAAEGLDHIRFLLRLAELELIDRERRMVERRIKEARLPAVKSLDSFDFADHAGFDYRKALGAGLAEEQMPAIECPTERRGTGVYGAAVPTEMMP
jgi:DNA replication protein DnaC